MDVADYALSESTKRASGVPEGKITILDGREVSPKVHGPFDAVLGNSVFCIYGKRDVPYHNITYVMEMFPFSVFESMLDEIDLYLKVGGVLTVFNSNYDFMDTHLADRYEPISDKKCPNHFVPRIDQENKKFVDVKDEMMDCLFRKVKRTSAAPALIATAQKAKVNRNRTSKSRAEEEESIKELVNKKQNQPSHGTQMNQFFVVIKVKCTSWL